MDVESQEKRKCLDGFLVVSVVILFISVLSLFAGGVILLKVRNSSKEDGRWPPVYQEQVKQTDHNNSPSYKMEYFAYVYPSSSMLQNHTMKWQTMAYGEGNSVGEHFHFDQKLHSLYPKVNGYYFIYFQLNLTCSYKCEAGRLTLSFKDKLSCSVDLPPNWAETTPVSKKCWTVAQLDGKSQLFIQMTISETGLDYWKLDLNSSGLGVFLLR